MGKDAVVLSQEYKVENITSSGLMVNMVDKCFLFFNATYHQSCKCLYQQSWNIKPVFPRPWAYIVVTVPSTQNGWPSQK